jgi:branched-chain amino acid transport system ATP-binding protein
MNMNSNLLQVKNLQVAYQRAGSALHGISFDVGEGASVGLIGTNGAGKTTTLNAIAGFMRGDIARITAGEIHFEGQRIDSLLPHQIASRGVALIPEQRKIFTTLTVRENLEACRAGSGDRVVDIAGVFDFFPALAGRRDIIAGYLSGGERQMLAIAMGLLCAPKLLMIDEMSLGLSPAICFQLSKMVGQLRDKFGLGFLLVEQNAVLALDTVDFVYVVEHGQIVASGPADVLKKDPRFRAVYLGLDSRDETQSYRRRKPRLAAVGGISA